MYLQINRLINDYTTKIIELFLEKERGQGKEEVKGKRGKKDN